MTEAGKGRETRELALLAMNLCGLDEPNEQCCTYSGELPNKSVFARWLWTTPVAVCQADGELTSPATIRADADPRARAGAGARTDSK